MRNDTFATILVVGFVFICGLVLVLGAIKEDANSLRNPSTNYKVDMLVQPKGIPTQS
jgi:hypothetical protein